MTKNIFQSVLTRKPKLNKFDLGHEKKMSLKMGKLYPSLLQEIVPGDRFKVSSEIMLRLAPMLAPIMHRVNVTTHYFFVPNRLVWNEWESFITGGEDGTEVPTFPTLGTGGGAWESFKKGSLPDYMGIPVTETSPTVHAKISALPFRAYQLIYNEYFRDQNLQTKIPIPLNSGVQTPTEVIEMCTIRDRAWEKDYFTSSLPWSQRGGEATIPIGSVEPVYLATSKVLHANGDDATGNMEANAGALNIEDPILVAGRIENLDTMPVDAVTINDLRKANKLQEWLEKSARGGSRYIEQILSHFGVRSSDARLQRPEFLGGGSQPVVISEVLQTSESDVASADSSPQGNMAGHGISVGRNASFSKSFEEHGYIIGIISILPKTTYQQGLDRTFSKFDKFDYYWPEFANLGEQEVLSKEIYLDYVNATNGDTFGYQQRYAEYKYQQSTVHGDFRDSLSFWHMGRIFDSIPNLNQDFVMSDPTKRIFAVEDEEVDEIYCQIYNNISALRPMPYFSIPSL